MDPSMIPRPNSPGGLVNAVNLNHQEGVGLYDMGPPGGMDPVGMLQARWAEQSQLLKETEKPKRKKKKVRKTSEQRTKLRHRTSSADEQKTERRRKKKRGTLRTSSHISRRPVTLGMASAPLTQEGRERLKSQPHLRTPRALAEKTIELQRKLLRSRPIRMIRQSLGPEGARFLKWSSMPRTMQRWLEVRVYHYLSDEDFIAREIRKLSEVRSAWTNQRLCFALCITAFFRAWVDADYIHEKEAPHE